MAWSRPARRSAFPPRPCCSRASAMTLAQPRGVARETRRLAGTRCASWPGSRSRARQGRPALRRPGVGAEPGFPAAVPAVPRAERSMEPGRRPRSGPRSWQDAERARFMTNILMSAAGADQLPGDQPGGAEASLRHGGASVLRGAGHWVADVRQNGGMPSQTDRTAFQVGTDLAVTPGAVVIATTWPRSSSTRRRRPTFHPPRRCWSSRRRSAATTSSTCGPAAVSSNTRSAGACRCS